MYVGMQMRRSVQASRLPACCNAQSIKAISTADSQKTQAICLFQLDVVLDRCKLFLNFGLHRSLLILVKSKCIAQACNTTCMLNVQVYLHDGIRKSLTQGSQQCS